MPLPDPRCGRPLGDPVRYQLVKAIVASGMLAGMLLSPKLWLTDRHFPLAPVWDGLPAVPPPWDAGVFGGMLVLLGLAALPLRRCWPLPAFVALAAAWSLWDQSRWQPWFYQYLVMLAALGFAAGRCPERRAAGLHVCRLVVAATYIWSGLQKVNVTFATEVYPWFVEPALRLAPPGWAAWAAGQGWAAAGVECALGIGLLAWPLRAAAVPLVVGMHALVLFCLGPWGHDWNTVVWPWNLAMMALDVALFARTRGVAPWHIAWPQRFPFARLALVLFGVLPALSFCGRWDSYLSAALYSGNTPRARVRVGDPAAAALPPDVREGCLDGDELSLAKWSVAELNVPPYPARRVYRAVARQLAALGDPPGGVTLDVEERPDWLTGRRAVTRENLGDP